MRTLLKLLLPIGVFLIAVTAAFGQFSFNEFGLATGPGIGAANQGIMVLDPTSGMVGLSYLLPFPVAPGDLLALEPPLNQQPSDLIRFGFGPPAAPGPRLWFFSDLPDEPGAPPADVGLPVPIAPVILFESGVEGGAQGFIWTPVAGSGAPGDAGFPVTYTFISDVPEPASVTLVGLGLVGFLTIIRRRK